MTRKRKGKKVIVLVEQLYDEIIPLRQLKSIARFNNLKQKNTFALKEGGIGSESAVGI